MFHVEHPRGPGGRCHRCSAAAVVNWGRSRPSEHAFCGVSRGTGHFGWQAGRAARLRSSREPFPARLRGCVGPLRRPRCSGRYAPWSRCLVGGRWGRCGSNSRSRGSGGGEPAAQVGRGGLMRRIRRPPWAMHRGPVIGRSGRAWPTEDGWAAPGRRGRWSDARGVGRGVPCLGPSVPRAPNPGTRRRAVSSWMATPSRSAMRGASVA